MEIVFLAGFAGGVLRGLVGFIKHQYSYKNVAFNLPYFLSMATLSGVIGLAAAYALRDIGADLVNSPLTPAVALVAGYAGGDLLENLGKIILKKA